MLNDGAATTPLAAPAASAQKSSDSWANVKARLRQKLGDDIFDSWFCRMNLEEIEEGTVRLSVLTRFLKSWILSHYAENILECWQEEDSKIIRIEISTRTAVLKVLSSGLDSKIDNIGKSYANRTDDVLARNVSDAGTSFEGSLLDPRLTFETFVVGPSNVLAHAAVKRIAAAKRSDKLMFNPLYVHAQTGMGKTHLLQALALASDAFGERKTLYLTAEKFMYGFVSALRAQNAASFKEALRTVGVLIVDDLQFLSGKATQAEFGKTLNLLMRAGQQVVVAADRPPGDLENFDYHIRSQFVGGLVVKMGVLEEELRFEILKARAASMSSRQHEFDVPLPVIGYIAKAVVSNGRDLEAALNRLLAHNKLAGHPVTLEMAERECCDLVRPQEPRRVRIEEIQQVVARNYNVSRASLMSSRRTADVVRPRQVAMYLAKTLTLRSLPDIGRRFGGRDHTTVLYAFRKIENLVQNDTALAEKIELIKQQLRE